MICCGTLCNYNQVKTVCHRLTVNRAISNVVEGGSPSHACGPLSEHSYEKKWLRNEYDRRHFV